MFFRDLTPCLDKTDESQRYFAEVKELIETMYQENGNRPVILVGHSMGCLFSYHLLLQNSQEWRDKYIKSWITIAAPFAGAFDSMKSIIAGSNLNIPIFRPVVWRPLFQTLSSVHYLMPDAGRFNDSVIMTLNGTDYTAGNIDDVFRVMDHPLGYKMWKNTRSSFVGSLGYPFPNVTTHCLRGINVPTPERINFIDSNSVSINSAYEIINGDGDGTVNRVSADVCLDWSENENFFAEVFPGVTHTSMVKDNDVVSYIVRQVLHTNLNYE